MALGALLADLGARVPSTWLIQMWLDMEKIGSFQSFRFCFFVFNFRAYKIILMLLDTNLVSYLIHRC